MHELAATESLLSLVLEEATKARASRVTRIKLKVGEWSSFVPECVRFYLEVLSQGTAAEGAELEWETVRATFECTDCRATYPLPDQGAVQCPECSSQQAKLVAGREFELIEIEVEDENPCRAQSARGE